jgi:hypothetical protein
VKEATRSYFDFFLCRSWASLKGPDMSTLRTPAFGGSFWRLWCASCFLTGSAVPFERGVSHRDVLLP